MMKAKSMAARFGVATFVKGALVAAAFCMAATSALALFFLCEEDGLVYLMFRAAKNTLRIYIR